MRIALRIATTWLAAAAAVACSGGSGAASGATEPEALPQFQIVTASGGPLEALAGDALSLKVVEVLPDGATGDLPAGSSVVWTSPSPPITALPPNSGAPSQAPRGSTIRADPIKAQTSPMSFSCSIPARFRTPPFRCRPPFRADRPRATSRLRSRSTRPPSETGRAVQRCTALPVPIAPCAMVRAATGALPIPTGPRIRSTACRIHSPPPA